MKPAIAIKSCHKFGNRRKAQLDTWLSKAEIDFFFLIGMSSTTIPPPADSLMCAVSDAFENIAPKLLCGIEYALNENVTNLLVVDDDTYVAFDRMMKSGFEKFDYLGFVRNSSGSPYMQGSCYWLSECAMNAIMRHKQVMLGGVPDDMAVGRCLYGEVPFTHEHRYSIGEPYPNQLKWPLSSNNIIAAHKMTPALMASCHISLTQ